MTVDHSGRLAASGGEKVHSFAFLIGVFACVILCALFILGVSGGREISGIELDSRINPNNAPISSLVRLPGIGMSRAAAIVAYRDAHGLGGSEGAAFRNCDDLQKIKGIGPKTAEAMAQWVVFE